MRHAPSAVLACALMLVAFGQVGGGQVASGQAAAGSALQNPTGTGAISGVVVDATTQKPLPGAIVQIFGAAAVPGSSPAFRAVRQITDEQGRFLFTELPAIAGYGLTASRFGYFNGAYGRRAGLGSGAVRRISLADGQWLRDARVELLRPSSINGTVVDESGDPVVGVTVRAYTELYVAGVRQLASSVAVTTDDRGVYRIANLPPGRYIVAVPSVQHAVPAGLSAAELSGMSVAAAAAAEAAGRAGSTGRDPAFAVDPAHRLIVLPDSPTPPPSAAGQLQIYPTLFHPASRTVDDAAPIQLQAGEDRPGVDLRLQPVPAFRVSGRLDGPPDAIAGMSIRLMPAGSERLGHGSESATALAGTDGSFMLLNVPNGAYTILASRSVSEYAFRSPLSPSVSIPTPPGLRTASSSSSAVFSAPQGTMFTQRSQQGSRNHQGRQTVTVSGRDVTDVVVRLQPGVKMTGRFVFESTKGASPAMRVLSVAAEPANGDSSLGLPRAPMRPTEQSTDFTIEGLLPGAYLIRLIGGGVVKSIMWNGRDHTFTPFDTTTGRDISDVVITFTDETTTVSGAIRDRTGQPAANAAVIVFPAERAQWTNFGMQPTRIRSTPGSTSGTYTLRSLPAGDYLVLAVDDESADRWKDPAFLEAASRVATRVSIAWGEAKAQDLTMQEVR